jgi:fructosamine-3-kinase
MAAHGRERVGEHVANIHARRDAFRDGYEDAWPLARGCDGYEDAWPLARGYPLRRDLYNVYHLLSHANLFGGAYVARTQRAIAAVLAHLGH